MKAVFSIQKKKKTNITHLPLEVPFVIIYNKAPNTRDCTHPSFIMWTLFLYGGVD